MNELLTSDIDKQKLALKEIKILSEKQAKIIEELNLTHNSKL